jgi:hypothetical protein
MRDYNGDARRRWPWPIVVPYVVDSTSFLRWTRTHHRRLVLRTKHAAERWQVRGLADTGAGLEPDFGTAANIETRA